MLQVQPLALQRQHFLNHLFTLRLKNTPEINILAMKSSRRVLESEVDYWEQLIPEIG